LIVRATFLIASSRLRRAQPNHSANRISATPTYEVAEPPVLRAREPVDPLAQERSVLPLALDALLCPKCGGRRKVLAFLTNPEVVRKILLHLGLETAPPALAPARMGERDLRLWEWEAGGLEWDEGDVVQPDDKSHPHELERSSP